MKKIIAFLFSTLFVCGAAAQNNGSEPFLPPMDDYNVRPSLQQTYVPVLTVRGMTIEDGYGVLNYYGASRLFGGTPAYADFSAAMRYGRLGNYLLWSGVGFSTVGLVTIIFAATEGSDFDFDFWESGGGWGLGFFLAGLPFIATGATYTVKAKKRLARAVDIYNEYSGTSSYNHYAPELSLGLTSGGMGLVFKF